MSGGSVEPEGPHDEACPKCGLYYHSQGNSLNMHKAACDGDGSSGTESTDESTPEPPSQPADATPSPDTTENPALASPSAETDTGGSGGNTCDECSGDLLEPGDTFTMDGTTFQVDPGEYICVPCGLAYSEGEV